MGEAKLKNEAKKKEKKHPLLIGFGGFFAGIVNGLLGAGGGMLVVPLLRKSGLPTKKCHATCIAVILPISILSAVIYLVGGKLGISEPLPYLPAGIIGAILGTILLSKLKGSVIRRIFGLFMLWAAIRMFFN